MNINIDFILMVVFGLVVFYLHSKHTTKTIDGLLGKVSELTDKVMARTLNEVTQKVAIQAQAEINKVIAEAIKSEPKKESLDEKPVDENEQVL